jgi:hypothetical protein
MSYLNSLMGTVGVNPSMALQVMSIRPKLIALGIIGAVIFMGGIIITSVVANHIHKSSCKDDPTMKTAYKWSWISALIYSTLFAISAGGAIALGISYFI